MTDRLDLPRCYRDQLEALLRAHLPGVEVWAYGSRVNGHSHDGSDLDLVLRGPGLHEIPVGQVADFAEAMRDSSIPFLVEARDWARLPERFQREIERGYVVLVEGESGRCFGPSTQCLGDVAEIVMGQSPPGKTVSEFHGLALLNGPTEFGAHHPVPVQFTTDARKFADKGDLLFCVRGSTTGRMNWADQRYAIGRGVAAIRHRHETTLQPFIRAVIEFALPELLTQATGSTFPNVSAHQLAAIPYPNLDEGEQRAIARILGILDDKIELNRRMNETLEGMAQALFQSWFVDFDPVRAKAALKTGGTTSATDGRLGWSMDRARAYLDRMAPEIATLFPDHFVDSELGEIPAGWEVKALGNSFDLTMGQSPPGSTYNEQGEGLPFFQGRADFGFRYPKSRKFCTAPTRIAQLDDTLVSIRAPVGEMNMAWERCCVGRGVAALRHKSGSPSYTYYAVEALQPEIRQYEHTGTVFGAITKKQFMALRIVEPPLALVDWFRRCAMPLDERIRTTTAEINTLYILRDALLPKLISGKVKVRTVKVNTALNRPVE